MSITEISESFKPSDKHLAFLDAFLNKTPEQGWPYVCKRAGIGLSTYYDWRKNDGFSKWFKTETDKELLKYVPVIKKSLFERACEKTASVQIIELALKLIGEYTPSQKVISEGILTETQLESILEKAKTKRPSLRTTPMVNPRNYQPGEIIEIPASQIGNYVQTVGKPHLDNVEN